MIDMGQWFGSHGYETAHFGKWHTTGRNPAESHDYNHGMHPAGQYADASVAQMATSYLMNRDTRKPFMAHVAFMNPHDICQVSCFHTGGGQAACEVPIRFDCHNGANQQDRPPVRSFARPKQGS